MSDPSIPTLIAWCRLASRFPGNDLDHPRKLQARLKKIRKIPGAKSSLNRYIKANTEDQSRIERLIKYLTTHQALPKGELHRHLQRILLKATTMAMKNRDRQTAQQIQNFLRTWHP